MNSTEASKPEGREVMHWKARALLGGTIALPGDALVAYYRMKLDTAIESLKTIMRLPPIISRGERETAVVMLGREISRVKDACEEEMAPERATEKKERGFDDALGTFDVLAGWFLKWAGNEVLGESARQVGLEPMKLTFGNVKVIVEQGRLRAVNVSSLARGRGVAEAAVEDEIRQNEVLLSVDDLESFMQLYRAKMMLEEDGSGYYVCPRCGTQFERTCSSCGENVDQLAHRFISTPGYAERLHGACKVFRNGRHL